jgi:NADP-dependent 3-hydroxy acid dehydrogenase YdfG
MVGSGSSRFSVWFSKISLLGEARDLTATVAMEPRRTATVIASDKVTTFDGQVGPVTGAGSVLESDVADYERAFGVNLPGVINGTKAFLPHLIESGNGHVVNISSLNGFLAQGLASRYCASLLRLTTAPPLS